MATLAGGQSYDPLEKSWHTHDSAYTINFLQDSDDLFYGKIVALKQPLGPDGKPRTDRKNPDRSFHNVPLLNMVIIGRLRKNFTYWDQYQDGSFYNPETGKMQCIQINQVSHRRLEVFIYPCQLGLLGKSRIWMLAE
jgi:hypothetical protein